MTPNVYTNVDPFVLKRAAERGTALHTEIEDYEIDGIMGHSIEFKNYLNLKEKYNLKIILNEIFIIIFDSSKRPLCAGRLDCIYMSNDDQIGILDFKRTSKYHKENVTLQLNLYKKGFYQCFRVPVKEMSCMRLRENVKEFHYVEIDNNLANIKLKEYLSKI